MNDIKKKWRDMTLSNKLKTISDYAGLAIALIAIAISMRSCGISEMANTLSGQANELSSKANEISFKSYGVADKSYKLAEQVYKTQNTPRLSAQIVGGSKVGQYEGRVDEVVTAGVWVLNNSEAFAHDVVLDFAYDDGTGRQGSLNEYFLSIKAPLLSIKSLPPRGAWVVAPRAISSPANSYELYSTGRLKFKMKLLLSWKDGEGKEYKSASLWELTYVKVMDKTTSESFWFAPKGEYDSIRNKEVVEKYWSFDFDY